MPRVLLDLRMVQGRLHGIARYALELACRLPALAPGWSFSALVPKQGLPVDLGPLSPRMPVHRSWAGFLSPLEQPTLAAQLATLKPDLFHATSFSLPALWPGKLVATLHDANHLALAEQYGAGQSAYYRLVVGPRAARAQVLLTVSNFSREELARHLHISPYRFQVIEQGVDARFQPPSASEARAFRTRWSLPERYLLAVGNAKAYKNLGLLAQLAPTLPVPIVLLAGVGASKQHGFPATTRELSEIGEDELPLLYGAASALLLPSRYEGFGLPVLEAMATGCPVIAAEAGALPEIVGDAGLRVGPDDVAGWKEAILELLRDGDLHRSLREAGLERASRFTWESSAKATLVAYERALSAS